MEIGRVIFYLLAPLPYNLSLSIRRTKARNCRDIYNLQVRFDSKTAAESRKCLRHETSSETHWFGDQKSIPDIIPTHR